MKTTQKQYKIFRDEFKRLVNEFELNNYEIAFELKDLENANANIKANSSNFKATVCLSAVVSYRDGKWKHLYREATQEEYFKKLAQHEAIHLLLAKYAWCAESRYVGEQELIDAEEELVNKIIHIINKLEKK